MNLKLQEIADRIRVHLKRFEADQEINASRESHANTKPYYSAFASVAGAYVYVQYISYQGGSNMRRADAEKYLAWLDAGNVGRHFEALR